MNLYIYIILSIIIVLGLFGILLLTIYNKYQVCAIRCDEASNNIDILLDKKYDVLKRVVDVIKDEVKTKDKFDSFDAIDINNISRYELSELLDHCQGIIYEYLDNDDKLRENEVICELDSEDIMNDLEAMISYYNDNVVLYNKLIKCFPSNIVGKMYRFEEKEFYKV